MSHRFTDSPVHRFTDYYEQRTEAGAIQSPVRTAQSRLHCRLQARRKTRGQIARVFLFAPRILGRRLARKLAIPPNARGRLIWIYADWGIGVALYLLYRGLWCASTPRPCYTIYNRYKLSIYTPISAYIITEGIRERDIEADLLYCFSSRQCAAVNPSDGFVDVNMLFSDGIRCFVGRLPMEDGVLSTKRRDEIMAYFGRAINQFQPSPNKPLGLEVESILGTACESCRRVAGVMMEGLPLLRLNEEKGITENDIFVSPQLNFEEGHNTVDDLITHSVGGQHYHNAAQHADMLTFMLHGSPAPEGRGYFGENYEKTANTLAFSPELFQTYPAKIVSGICCWGARYVNYRVEDSALLTALSNNVLLFTGSCRSAWGIFDVLMPQDEDVISCAEVLIDRYNRYLLQGQPAGLALYNAKMDCINTTDTEDAMPYNLCTILEFNLFGDPLLSVIQEETAYDWQTASVSPMAKQILSQRIQYEAEPQNEENMSLLEHMRKRTNVNLEFIRERVNRELYERCGLTPQALAAIITAKKNGTECGYIFRYTKQNGALVSHTLAHTDTQGHIHTVISSL